MMEALLPLTRKEEFALAAALEREFVLEKLKLARFEARVKREIEHEQIEEEKQDHETARAIETAFAPQQTVIEYRDEVDHLGTVTVDALTDNDKAYDGALKERKALLEQAFVLPDGRKVFKTVDGQRVFDEQGQELSSETINPENIDDKRPRWEQLAAVNDKVESIFSKRRELLDYQQKLDDARERLDKGEITNGELDRLKTNLAQSMPDAVRQKL